MGTVSLSPGSNIQQAVNNNPGGTIFNLSAGTYSGAQFLAKSNDQFIGDSAGGTVLDGNHSTPYLTYDNGATGVVLQNLTVQNYASPALLGAIQTGQYWTLNGVTAQDNQGAGVTLGANSVIQGGQYNNNGEIGIDGFQADNAQVNGAEVAYNNTSGSDIDYNAGGMKFVSSADVVLVNNAVHDNTGQGIWTDVDSTNWDVENNAVWDNTGAGIQEELSHGGLIANNQVWDNGRSDIYLSNSDGATVTGNNVTVHTTNGVNWNFYEGGIDIVSIARGSGPYGVYQSVNDTVTGNTIVHTGDTALDGIALYQSPTTGGAFGGNVFDGNTYELYDNNQHWGFYSAAANGSAQLYNASGLQNSGVAFDQNSAFNYV